MFPWLKLQYHTGDAKSLASRARLSGKMWARRASPGCQQPLCDLILQDTHRSQDPCATFIRARQPMNLRKGRPSSARAVLSPRRVAVTQCTRVTPCYAGRSPQKAVHFLSLSRHRSCSGVGFFCHSLLASNGSHFVRDPAPPMSCPPSRHLLEGQACQDVGHHPSICLPQDI